MAPDRTSFEHDSCHGDGCNAYLEGKLGAMLITSKTTSGRGGGGGECLLLVLTLSCLFYPPPTHFHQTISLSNAEVKVCISYRSSWNRQGLCEMNIIARRAGALPGWLYLSLHNTATLSPLSFPFSCPRPNASPGSSGHRGDAVARGGGSWLNLTPSLQNSRFFAGLRWREQDRRLRVSQFPQIGKVAVTSAKVCVGSPSPQTAVRSQGKTALFVEKES